MDFSYVHIRYFIGYVYHICLQDTIQSTLSLCLLCQAMLLPMPLRPLLLTTRSGFTGKPWRCQRCAGTGYMAPQSQIQISQMDMFRASCPSSEYTMTNHGGHPTKAEKIEIVNNNRITNYTSWRGSREHFFFPRRWPPPITSSSLSHCACHTVITVCTFKYVQ